MRRSLATIHRASCFTILVTAAILLGVVLAGYSFVGTVTAVPVMYLKPSHTSYIPGQTLTISVRVKTARQKVNAVQADFTYPASYLEFQGIDATKSAFGVEAIALEKNGTVSIARGSLSEVSGDVLVAKVNFKVRDVPHRTTASVDFAPTSALVRSTDNTDVLHTMRGSNFAIRKQ